MNRKYLIWASVLLSTVILMGELWFTGIDLVWILCLGTVLACQVVYLLLERGVKLVYSLMLVAGILTVATGMKLMAPELTAREVKAILGGKVVSVKYRGLGIWEAKNYYPPDVILVTFDEKTGVIDIKR